MHLKILRVMANLTQAEAAAKVGVTQAALSDWENGKYRPSPAAISKLAEVYNVTEADVLKAIEATNAARGGESDAR